jgi:acetolactate decarboxylase
MAGSKRQSAALAFFVGLVAACQGSGPADPNSPRAPPKVEHAGVMSDLFETRSAAGTIALAPLLARPHLYALGPLADMTGELLVWDGTPFTSRVQGGRVVVATERDLSVPLIVMARVAKWKEVAVPDEACELAAFETWLPKAARDAGLDDRQPFAFQIVGAVRRATLHVVALPPGTPLTHEAHDATKTTLELGAAPIQALGFHATDAKGIWTHHDRNVHVHLRTLIGSTMGHVDDFELAPGAVVRLAWR